ncbi:MAG: glycosyltransferase family 4 protein [Planctomycetota bacterium]|nr:glycosyltransferase family 4 protein [Planctomycetota bacterium]
MKVLIVIHDYLPEHAGGSELHAHQVAKELLARGHEVTALFTERDITRPEGDFTDGEFEGVRTVEVIHQREYPRLDETWNQSLFAEVFRAQLKRLAPDVVHFHHVAFWGARCLKVAKEEGVRVVLTLHDFFLVCHNSVLLNGTELCDGGGARGRCGACLPAELLPDGLDDEAREAALLAGAAERRALHQAMLHSVDFIVSPSRYLLERLTLAGFDVPAERSAVLLYGYPGERAPVRQREAAAPLRVGYLGGLYPAKGVHVLVEAFRHLATRDRSGKALIELEVRGHLDWFPDYVGDLQSRAAGLAVTFAGPYASGEAGRVLAAMDVLVVPSIWYENRPITISEAYLAGVVPLVTDLGGMAESVRAEEDGLTFPRGDAAALADQLERLADEPGLWDRLAAGRPELPDAGEVVDALLGYYRGSSEG